MSQSPDEDEGHPLAGHRVAITGPLTGPLHGLTRRSAPDLLQELGGRRAIPSRAQTVAGAGGWTVILPGPPFAGDGATVDDAVAEVIDALREYADDWQSDVTLRTAPNHRDNDGLVSLIALSDGQVVI